MKKRKESFLREIGFDEAIGIIITEATISYAVIPDVEYATGFMAGNFILRAMFIDDKKPELNKKLLLPEYIGATLGRKAYDVIEPPISAFGRGTSNIIRNVYDKAKNVINKIKPKKNLEYSLENEESK